MKTIKLFLVLLPIIEILFLIPYVIIGETWGMVLFMICLPSSILFNYIYFDSIYSLYYEIAIITLIQASLISLLLSFGWTAVRRLSDKNRSI